jgi:hypothetical protein
VVMEIFKWIQRRTTAQPAISSITMIN